MSAQFKIFAIFICLAFLLVACAPPAAPTPTSEIEGPPPAETDAPAPAETEPPVVEEEPVTLYIGWLGQPDTLNPAYAFLTESYTTFDLVYSPLTTEAPSGEYVGGIAQEWSHSEDGLTWTFSLKDGLKWHNGEDLTADQVVWAINAVMKDPDGWAAISNYTNGFKEVTALDPKTIQITLENPISNMEYRLSFLYPVYPPDFEGFTTPEDLQNFTNFELVGNGPFKINTYDKDKGILVLDANPDYIDGAPKIDQVIFQTFDNADAMVQALKVGDVDLVTEVPQSAFEAVKGFENVEAISTPSRSLAELIVNSAPEDYEPAPIRNPAIVDPAVRQAIAHAINKQDIVDIVLQGLGEPGLNIIPPTLGGGFWYNSDIQDVPFDIAQAKQVLEDAGYTLGSDGVYEKGDIRLDFRLQFPSDSAVYPRVADLLAGWLGEAGIKATPESVDPDSLVASTTAVGDYDLVIWGWGSDPDPDFMLSVMTSDQYVEGGWSDSGYSNPEYDQLYLDQQTVLDPEERKAIIWKMQEMLFTDKPYIILYYENTLQAYRPDRFTGFIVSPLGIEAGASLVQVEPVK